MSEKDIAKAVPRGCRSSASLQDSLAISKCRGARECAARESFVENTHGNCEKAA
jgi:hypothetical protein